MLVDSHSHLDTFGDQVPQVLAAARAAGVGHIVVCGVTLRSSEHVLNLARAYPGQITAAAGWHPWQVREPLSTETYAAFRRLVEANRDHIGFLGEIGLDYNQPHGERKELQLEVFRQFVRLACELEMPMTIHVRGPAQADAIRVLEGERTPGLKGVVHGFDGQESEAHRYLEMGLLLSAGRNQMLGPQSERVQEVFRSLPLERLLVETDASYRPERDVNPSPAQARDVAQKLAEIKGVSLDEVERVTTRNFEALVGKSISQG